jgi:GNAT superfamily N-acetyltransferase
MGKTYKLTPLHNRTDFDCGNQALNKYIRSSVDRDIHNRLTQCYVALDQSEESVIGFYTLSNFTVSTAQLPRKYARKIPLGYLVPTILLGRLAVDLNYQAQGLGGFLLVDSMHRSLSAAKISNAYALVTHAKDDKAVNFYKHYGFLQLAENPRHLFLPLKTIEQNLL